LDEAIFSLETIYFNPDESSDKESISIMAVKQVVSHISATFDI
jgi:hypothetical protein